MGRVKLNIWKTAVEIAQRTDIRDVAPADALNRGWVSIAHTEFGRGIGVRLHHFRHTHF